MYYQESYNNEVKRKDGFWSMCGFDPVKHDIVKRYSAYNYYLYAEALLNEQARKEQNGQ